MRKDILLTVIMIIAIIIVGMHFYARENIEDIEPIDWCIPGTNLVMSVRDTGPVEDQNTTNEINFQIINLTTYKGKEVCQAEYIYDDGVLIQYFTKNNNQIFFIYKNSSGDINEIEINQSSFEYNYEDMVYEDTDYEN